MATYSRWLDVEIADSARLVELLKPFPAKGMGCYPVNPLVCNVRNNLPASIEPGA